MHPHVITRYFLFIAVANYKNYTCHHHRPVTSNTSTGYISTIPLDDLGGGHGSSRCPLVIQGQPGQRINITAFRYVHPITKQLIMCQLHCGK